MSTLFENLVTATYATPWVGFFGILLLQLFKKIEEPITAFFLNRL